MSKYSLISIGDVAEFINGLAFKPEDWVDQGYKIIRIQNLTDPSKPYNRTKRVVPEKYIVRKGDVLVSWSATIDVFEWDDEDAVLNQHIFKVEFDHSKITKNYFIYALKKTIGELTKYAHGSTMKHVVKKDFDNHKIPLPPLPDQIRIANILSKAEALISQRKESLRLLDEFLKSTFLEMFGDPMRNEKGWEMKRLNQISKIGTGGTPSRKREADYYGGNVNWAKTTEVNGSQIYSTEEKITELALKDSNCKVYPVNTILLAMYGQGKTRGNVGLLKIESATNQACAAILPSEMVDQIFLFELLKRSYEYIRGLARGGNQENLNLNIVGGLEIILPPIKLQIQFAHIVEKTEALKARYQTSLQELENLYGSLSQRAFRGELNLKEGELSLAAEPKKSYAKKTLE